MIQIEEGQEETHIKQEAVDCLVEKSEGVVKSAIEYDKGPGKDEWLQCVDNLPIDHVFFLAKEQQSKYVVFAKESKKSSEHKYYTEIHEQYAKGGIVARYEIGRDPKIDRSVVVDFFLGDWFWADVEVDDGEGVDVETVVEKREVFVDLFWDGEVEEDVETASGDVVEETQEVNCDWQGSSSICNAVGSGCAGLQGIIYGVVECELDG